MIYVNKNTGKTLTEKQYNELLHRENLDAWENDLNAEVEEFKEEGKGFADYEKHIADTYCDSDFEMIEE